MTIAGKTILVSTADLRRLLISLFLALILWSVVTTSQDPQTTRAFSNLSVNIGELPGSLQVVGAVPQIVVRVSGPQSRVDDLLSTDMHASLDLSGIDSAGNYTVPIDVSSPGGIWSARPSPSRIPIVVEETVARQFPLTIQVTGNFDATQQVGNVSTDVSEVTVRGPASAVGRVTEVVLPVAVDSQRRDFTSVFVPVAHDASGGTISEVDIAPGNVTTTVELTARGKRIAVITQVLGVPAPGYEVVDRTINPSTVLVDGPASALASLISVSTDVIDVSNAKENVARRVDLIGLPDGVTLLDPTDGAVDVVVQIRIQGERQSLPSQPVDVIGLGPGLTAELGNSTVSVTVIAADETIAKLSSGDIVVHVQTAGLGPGTYRLRPSIAVPANMTWVSTDPTEIEVTITQAQSTPVATPRAVPKSTPGT